MWGGGGQCAVRIIFRLNRVITSKLSCAERDGIWDGGGWIWGVGDWAEKRCGFWFEFENKLYRRIYAAPSARSHNGERECVVSRRCNDGHFSTTYVRPRYRTTQCQPGRATAQHQQQERLDSMCPAAQIQHTHTHARTVRFGCGKFHFIPVQCV